MKINYIVNFGVDWSHRRMNNTAFEKYADALRFYHSKTNHPLKMWKGVELVKVESQGKYEKPKLIVKRWFKIHQCMVKDPGNDYYKLMA